jgi:hypothetical protein
VVFGAECGLPENLARLRRRSVGLKRLLAVREVALGIEALTKLVRSEALYIGSTGGSSGFSPLKSEPVDCLYASI